ncbi:MAG: Crp/Fnr family transcriptional regulator [Bacteroidaceae bacterium]|nr:Crp/Fnr family transcriptional regulator [Bacteroidaceae bacterium]
MEKNREIARLFAKRYGENGTLSSQSIEWLAQILIPIKTLKGDYVLTEGTVCKHIYYIDRGLVRQTYTKKGKVLTEHIGHEGSIIICIESMLNKVPSHLSIECLEPCWIYALPYDDIVTISHSSFELCNVLMSIFKESLILSQRKADTLRYSNAMERYKQTLADYPEIIRRTPLHIVASYLQITPETLSRVRTQYHEEQAAANSSQ